MNINKRGQAVSLGNAPQIVLLLVLTVMITAAAALAVQSFRDSTTSNGWAYNISDDGLSGLGNLASQVPTVGTIIGVALIITVVVGAFAFFMTRRSGGM
jgi:hypothetical protein